MGHFQQGQGAETRETPSLKAHLERIAAAKQPIVDASSRLSHQSGVEDRWWAVIVLILVVGTGALMAEFVGPWAVFLFGPMMIGGGIAAFRLEGPSRLMERLDEWARPRKVIGAVGRMTATIQDRRFRAGAQAGLYLYLAELAPLAGLVLLWVVALIVLLVILAKIFE